MFPWSPKTDAIQWGGGSTRIAEFFRSCRTFPWSPKADAIQWGGGVGSSKIVSVVSKSRRDSVGGG